MKRTVIAALAATSMFAGTAATAATVSVEAHNTPNLFLDANGENDFYVPTQFMVGSFQSDLTLAGAFRLKDVSNTISDFIAFCLEPAVPLILPNDYEMGSMFSSAITENLQALASNAFDLVTDDNTAGAFQMAVWEIATETASVFDIDTGFFKITGAQVESDQAEALAQTWVDNVQNDVWTASSEYLILNANGTQDLLTNITIAAVPVPASGLLLIGGLAGAGAFARRKKAAK
jgi:hypothetical protein